MDGQMNEWIDKDFWLLDGWIDEWVDNNCWLVGWMDE